MKEEMDTLKEIETFELAQLPPNNMCYQNRQNQKEIYEARLLLYKVFFFSEIIHWLSINTFTNSKNDLDKNVNANCNTT